MKNTVTQEVLYHGYQNVYSSSQLPPALGVFYNLHEVLQALFPTIPAPTLKNREIWVSISKLFDM